MAIRRRISAVVVADGNDDAAQDAADAILRLAGALEKNAEEYELIVVGNDGGGNVTVEHLAAERLAEAGLEADRVRFVQHGHGAGYGARLRAGIEQAKLPLVLQLDSSNSLDLSVLPQMLEQIDRHELVVGFRLGNSRGRRDERGGRLGVHRRIGGAALRWVWGVVFGVYVRDYDCPLKLYRRKIFRHLRLMSDSRLIDVEIPAKSHVLGYRIEEVGVPLLADRRPHRLRFGEIARMAVEAWHLLHSFDLEVDADVRHASPEAEEK